MIYAALIRIMVARIGILLNSSSQDEAMLMYTYIITSNTRALIRD